jgi:hypothetical protein
MSVLLDGFLSLYVHAVYKNRVWQSVKDAFMYLAGSQAVYMSVSLVCGFAFLGSLDVAQHRLIGLLSPQVVLFLGMEMARRGFFVTLLLFVFSVSLFLYALVLPCWLLAGSLRQTDLVASWVTRLPITAVIASTFVFAGVTLGWYEAGNWLYDQLVTHENAAVFSNLTCEMGAEMPAKIRAIATVENQGKKAKLLSQGDIQLLLVADLENDEAEAKYRASFYLEDPLKRGRFEKDERHPVEVRISDSSQGAEKPAYLVPPGQQIWIELTSYASPPAFQYAKKAQIFCAIWPVRFYAANFAYGLVRGPSPKGLSMQDFNKSVQP